MVFGRSAYLWLIWAYLVILPIQVAVAGYGVFSGDFDPHEMLGGLVLHIALPLLMLLAVAVGSVGWKHAGLAFGLFALLTLQIGMVPLGGELGQPWVSGLHPFLAFMSWLYVYFLQRPGAVRALDAARGLDTQPPAAA